MRPTRRNLLIGLATATVGGGAAFGSGAFSQVEADRTVNISVSNDGNTDTLLQLDANDQTDLVTNDGGYNSNELIFNLENLNDNAVTTVSPAFTITNNGSQNVAIRVQVLDSNSSMVDAFSFTSETSTNDLTSYPGNGDSGHDNNLDANGGSVTVDMQIDSDSGTPTDANVIRIEADESQYQA